MTGIVLHIGLSKTATTTLQRAVFQHHSQIYYLGKIAGSRHGRQCASADTYEFLAPMLWQTDQPCDIAAAKDFYAETLEPRAGANQVILGSWEGLGQQGIAPFEASVQRLLAVCGVCRILISLRDPVTRLPSMYLQHLRGNQKQLARTYVTFDEWLDSQEQQLGSLEGVFAYREYVEVAVRLLGAANVGVFLLKHSSPIPDNTCRMSRVSWVLMRKRPSDWPRVSTSTPGCSSRRSTGCKRYTRRLQVASHGVCPASKEGKGP